MSFDVFLFTSNLSTTTKETVNPFTGEKVQMPVGETVNDAERDALKQLLNSVTPSGCDDLGCYIVQLSDGSAAQVFFGGLADDEECVSGMIALRGLSMELARFIYSLAAVGNMVVIPAMEPPATIVVSQDTAARVASRWPDATVIASHEDLYGILSKGVDAWIKYRDQCLVQSGEDSP